MIRNRISEMISMIKKYLRRSRAIRALAHCALIPLSFASSVVIAQPGGEEIEGVISSPACELELGARKATKGQLSSTASVAAALNCSGAKLDLGSVWKAEIATFRQRGDHMIVAEGPGGRRLLTFKRTNEVKLAPGSQRFGEYVVTERALARALVSFKSFEELGIVRIWHRGGP